MRNLKIVAAAFGALVFFEIWLVIFLIWLAQEYSHPALRGAVEALHVGFLYYSTVCAGGLFLLLLLQSGLQTIWRPRA
jgi:TRAP-type C4-dicarboxylate transport system permease small subunit